MVNDKLKQNGILFIAAVISFFSGLFLAWFFESEKINIGIVLDVFQFVVLAITIRLIISSIQLRKKTKEGITDLENAKKIYDDYMEQQTKFFNELNERADLLSRENSKVREENETLKDRLRNLGINDFDIIK